MKYTYKMFLPPAPLINATLINLSQESKSNGATPSPFYLLYCIQCEESENLTTTPQSFFFLFFFFNKYNTGTSDRIKEKNGHPHQLFFIRLLTIEQSDQRVKVDPFNQTICMCTYKIINIDLYLFIFLLLFATFKLR